MSFHDYVAAANYFEKKYSKKTLLNFIFKSRNKKRLLYIRLNIVKRYNDKIRIHPLSSNEQRDPISERDTKIFIENTIPLINLLTDVSPNDYFMIGELYRNIGEFDKAKET